MPSIYYLFLYNKLRNTEKHWNVNRFLRGASCLSFDKKHTFFFWTTSQYVSTNVWTWPSWGEFVDLHLFVSSRTLSGSLGSTGGSWTIKNGIVIQSFLSVLPSITQIETYLFIRKVVKYLFIRKVGKVKDNSKKNKWRLSQQFFFKFLKFGILSRP